MLSSLLQHCSNRLLLMVWQLAPGGCQTEFFSRDPTAQQGNCYAAPNIYGVVIASVHRCRANAQHKGQHEPADFARETKRREQRDD